MSFFSAQFFAIAVAHFFAVASPGPDFAIAVKQSVAYGSRTGIQTAIGIGLGILFHITYIVLGVGLFLQQSPTAFMVMKYIGAAYLLYIGVASLLSKGTGEDYSGQAAVRTPPTTSAAIITGLLTNALNPKATLFFLSLFTLAIDPATPFSHEVFYGIYLSLATMVWFSFISVVFNRATVRNFLLRAGIWFDRAMGAVLVILAITLIISN